MILHLTEFIITCVIYVNNSVHTMFTVVAWLPLATNLDAMLKL